MFMGVGIRYTMRTYLRGTSIALSFFRLAYLGEINSIGGSFSYILCSYWDLSLAFSDGGPSLLDLGAVRTLSIRQDRKFDTIATFKIIEEDFIEKDRGKKATTKVDTIVLPCKGELRLRLSKSSGFVIRR
jgi:hypothetical protein